MATQQWQGLGTVLGDDTLSQRKIWITIHIDPNVTPSQAALGCLCPYDINADGSMSAADLAAYMDLYNRADPTADVKPDACLNNCDLQAIVDAIGP